MVLGLSVIKEGDKVVIETVTLMDETEFVTRAEKIEGDILRVLSPMCKGAVIRVPEDTRVGVMVFSGDKVYKGKGVAASNFKDGCFHYTDIKMETELERFERRNYYRLPLMKFIKIMRQDSEEVVEGRTLDISGGGIKFSSSEEFYKGEKILIEFEMENECIELEGEVVTINEGVIEDCKYGTRFELMGDKVVDKIVSYIFKIQRDRIRTDSKLRR